MSSTNEIWIVDYITLTEEKIRDTYDKVLSIHPLTLYNKALKSLYLIREAEWVCIFNITTSTYTRILRIPYYFAAGVPTNNLIALLPPVPNIDEEIYNFAIIWGDKANKVAKYSIDRRVIEYLGQVPQQPQQQPQMRQGVKFKV